MKKCVYCLEYKVNTKDHVVARSWYPKATPQHEEKYKAPACSDCNCKYSAIEEELLAGFVHTLDLFDLASAGVGAGTYDLLNTKYKRNKRRYNALSLPYQAIYPGFGLTTAHDIGPYDVVLQRADYTKALSEKFVRGFMYRLHRHYIEAPYEIDVYEEDPISIDNVLDSTGTIIKRGPGLEIAYAMCTDDPVASFWRITLWNRFKTYAIVGTA